MRKFIVVGCGGSGGYTVRLLIDQLRADFRSRGWGVLPTAWQFLHVDVPVDADKGPGPLGDIKDLGGTYVSFSSPTNSYKATSLNVEAQLGQRGGDFSPLLGWEPRDRERANGIPVANGAGQYRAIGRMLTLPRLSQLRQAFVEAQARAVAPGAWGSVPMNEQGSDVIVPIVVGSMAGGSGASMFLDVCRVLGQLPGILPQNIGAFLYTADVFAELPESDRANVEGNAMGAVSEIIAAISRMSEPGDLAMMSALGLSVTGAGQPPFGRVLPIGRRIGGAGAFFGDGSAQGVYRGIARALAGVMSSDEASTQYLNYFIGNPTPVQAATDRFGWRISDTDLPFGSLGFSSLSLGRDRYLDYAAQRLARSCVDHLMEGHRQPGSQLPESDQIRLLIDNQWGVSMGALGLPTEHEQVPTWFQTVAFPQVQWEAMAREATAPVSAVISNTGPAQASAWLGAVGAAVGSVRGIVAQSLQSAAYRWSEGWALQLEQAARAEFLRVVAAFGLPYARDLMVRVRQRCDQIIGPMRDAGLAADGIDPVALDPGLVQQAAALGKQNVGAEHMLGQALRHSVKASAENRLRREALKVGSNVLRAWATDVLGALEREAGDAMRTLQHARSASGGGVGLAQLHTVDYVEWPDDSDHVPLRFNHAENDVLLTTAEHFPAQFQADVIASGSGATYGEGMTKLRSEVVAGRWETAGVRKEREVLGQRVRWRPACLPRSASDGVPTPESKPRYSLELTPTLIIERSRDRLDSPGDVFARFAGQSIREFLLDDEIADVDRTQRQDQFVAKFAEALAKARPVVGVDDHMAQRLHQMHGVEYTYSFSEIPFEPQDPVSAAIAQRLNSMPELASTTATNFQRSLKGVNSTAGKISVLGSYAKVSPLCYSSLLEPIKQRWDAATGNTRRGLWLWKRTRPIPAALAMSSDEAVRVVAGWYLGRVLGLVRQGPNPLDPSAAVLSARGWLTFGPFLESTEAKVSSPFDLLPGVLMSHAWALVRCAGDPELSPLAPYEALRHLVDTTASNEQLPRTDQMAGAHLLHAAFAGQPLRVGTVTYEGDGLSKLLLEDSAPRGPQARTPQGASGYPAAQPGYPGGQSNQGYPNQGYPNQGYPNQGYPAPQGYPNQGYPNQGYPAPQGYPNQGYPNQGRQDGYAGGYPAAQQGFQGGYGASPGYPPASALSEVEARHQRLVSWIDRQTAKIDADGLMRNGRSFVNSVERVQGATLYEECHPLVVQGFGLLRQLADAALTLGSVTSDDDPFRNGGGQGDDFI